MIPSTDGFGDVQMQCPRCGRWEPDFDGFGMLAHTRPAYPEGCGYCSHPSPDDGVCNICGAENVCHLCFYANGDPFDGETNMVPGPKELIGDRNLGVHPLCLRRWLKTRETPVFE